MGEELVGVATKGRFFGMAMDNLVAGLLALLVASRLPEGTPSPARGLTAVGVYLLYYFVQEGAGATTIGKRIFGLRVYRLDGSPSGWPAAAIRTAMRILEVNPLLFGALPGGIAVAMSKRRQRMGDMLAGTVVAARSVRQ